MKEAENANVKAKEHIIFQLNTELKQIAEYHQRISYVKKSRIPIVNSGQLLEAATYYRIVHAKTGDMKKF